MNQDSKASVTQRQFSRWAGVYDSLLFRIYFAPLYKKLRHIFSEKQEIYFRDGTKFLDIACGTAEMIFQLAQAFPRVEFIGTDFAPGMIVQAREKTKGLKNVTIVEASSVNLPFPSQMFDVILCSEAFHHFYEPQKALSEIHRVGKPNALFVLMDPAFDSMLEKIIFGFFARLIENYHKIYSGREMKVLLEQSGFAVESVLNYFLNNFFVSRKKSDYGYH